MHKVIHFIFKSLKKKKNSTCQVLFRNLNVPKILTKREDCIHEKILSERGDANPMWQGYFFSQARKAESANCSSGDQLAGVQAQEAIWGGCCGVSAGLRSPTSSISQESFIRWPHLSHSMSKSQNLEHQKFIIGPTLSFLKWANWDQRKGVKHLFYQPSVNQQVLEPALWSCSPPTKVTRDLEGQLWLPSWLWFGFKSLLRGPGQVI